MEKTIDASALLGVPHANRTMAVSQGYRTTPLTEDEEMAVFAKLNDVLVKNKIIKKGDDTPLSAWVITAEVIKASCTKWKSAKREGISNGAFGRDIKKALSDNGWVFDDSTPYWDVCKPLVDICFLATDGFGRMSKYCLPEFKKPATQVNAVPHAIADSGYAAYIKANKGGAATKKK